MNKEERHNLTVYLNEKERQELNLMPLENFKNSEAPDKIIVTSNPENIANARFITVSRFAGSVITPETLLNIMDRYGALYGRLTYKGYIPDLDLDTYTIYPFVQSWVFEDSISGQ